jgi:hypothetical protein
MTFFSEMVFVLADEKFGSYNFLISLDVQSDVLKLSSVGV